MAGDPSAAVGADAGGAAQAAAIEDLARVTRAVLGGGEDLADRVARAVSAPDGLAALGPVPCGGAVRTRDRLVSNMTMAGYGAREITDVLEGHLTPADLDAAKRQLMAGRTPQVVAAYLEARWRDPALPSAAVSPVPLAPGLRGRPVWKPGRSTPGAAVTRNAARQTPSLDQHVAAVSREHGIDAGFVRAVIAAESGWQPRVVSHAGAIGLMQLMPATAAALGVNPWDPFDNIRGGIKYLAGLLRIYGHPALALVAYNAGGQHADRVRAGVAVPYRETRRLIETVRAKYPMF